MKVNDDNLMEALKRQDPAAIEFVIDRYGPLIKAVLLRSLGEYGDRWEECFNDVLMALWHQPERFEEKRSQLKNWLCAIAKYKAIDLLRRERRADRGRVTLADEQWNSIADEAAANDEQDLAADELEKLLHCLSPSDRELFLRRYSLEQPIGQISAETGMSRGLIYTRISRGKKKIRSFYEKNGGEYSE